MGLYSSGALGGVEVLDGGLVGGELTAHVLSAQAAAHAAATAAAAAHQQQQIAVQQISKFFLDFHRNFLNTLNFSKSTHSLKGRLVLMRYSFVFARFPS